MTQSVRSQHLAVRLRQCRALFQVLGIVAVLVLAFAGFAAGSGGLTQWERDAETTWRLTGTVITYWVLAVGVIVQCLWLSWVSEAIAELLERAP